MSIPSTPMSWFTSFFSSSKPEAPSPSIQSPEKRLLEVDPPSESGPETARASQPIERVHHAQIDQPNRNKVIFGAGVAFFAFSLLITRRSFTRKRLAANPAFYTNAPGHVAQQSSKTSPALEALEALNIATINVVSLAMMATGGALWYLGINSMADARKTLRGGLGVDGSGADEKDAEEEFEEWMATVLSRKEAKDKMRDNSLSKVRTNERGKER